jgi:hypothetical protein
MDWRSSGFPSIARSDRFDANIPVPLRQVKLAPTGHRVAAKRGSGLCHVRRGRAGQKVLTHRREEIDRL